MSCEPNPVADATAAKAMAVNAAAKATAVETALIDEATTEATEPRISNPKRTTQQVPQDGRNGQMKVGPILGKERGATWEHIAGAMDSIHGDSGIQVGISGTRMKATRSRQQSISV